MKVYLFEEGSSKLKALLGGKGAGLAEMTRIGLPVPPGFTITTDVCRDYMKKGEKVIDDLDEEILEKIKVIERKTGKKFGDTSNPLLVSVRSGAPVSMPGMMDTVLNLGLNDETVKGLIKQTGNERFAYDAYRRLVQMYGRIVLGIPGRRFEERIERFKKNYGVGSVIELDAHALKKMVDEFKEIVREETGKPLPDNPLVQLKTAIGAVFRSWNGKRAKKYRQINKIPDDLGTAVNVQTMVFGNMGSNSGSGVGFTRDPSTGEKKLYGEYLLNAQGEDVVSGSRTPRRIYQLRNDLPSVYKELVQACETLEKHYRDVQDFEFTIEKGKLYTLQTRTGKRTAQAAVKIAVDMVKEEWITREEAIMRVRPTQLRQLLHRRIDPKAKVKTIAEGLPASPGAASGRVIFDTDEAAELGNRGEKIIMVRPETTPEDIHGMVAAQGVLTSRGGMTCFSGDTRVLTDNGFMMMKEVFGHVTRGEELQVLSVNRQTLKSEWKRIEKAMRRMAPLWRISVSQTGRSKYNALDVTPNHKMLTLNGREIVEKPLSELIRVNEKVLIVDRVPPINYAEMSPFDGGSPYLAGAMFSDGYSKLTGTHGQTVFTQKNDLTKRRFIDEVKKQFKRQFDFDLSSREKTTTARFLRGRLIKGSATDYYCYRKNVAEFFQELREDLGLSMLISDEKSLFMFIAGFADGDGTYSGNDNCRIEIFNSSNQLVEAIVTACLRLGILPKVVPNRDSYNVMISERLEDIVSRTKGIKFSPRKRKYDTKLFDAKQLLSDVVDEVNYKGRTRSYVERNRLIGARIIKQNLMPLANETLKQELKKIVNSDLRMHRVKKVAELGINQVYNIEVEDNHNYVVFTTMFTPVLVNNCHAAVVARGMGKPCVCGCSDIRIDLDEERFYTEDLVIKKGEVITLDGGTGRVILGEVPTVEPELSGELVELLKWADEVKTLGVRANADTPEGADKAREFGANGIGLCRTERMFNAQDRLPIVQEMILATSEVERKEALNKLLPMQKEDFKEIFRVMDGLPVCIRLLDLPLHEFLPKFEDLLVEVTTLRLRGGDKKTLEEKEKILKRVQSLIEHNPMLGHRGCRLGIFYPEIYEMQTRAIFEAATELYIEGVSVELEIMIPLLSEANELRFLREKLEQVAGDVMRKAEVNVKYSFGTMIEIPRAALTADEIAKYAEFFSFGTNDLTQTTWGYSRDDAEAKFLHDYLDKKIVDVNPFEVVDRSGVGKLMKIAIELGKKTRKDLKLGICGEHGGEPNSIEFCHQIGLDYVSCSPFRVPVARLAAAQAKIKWPK